ncbi:uncharacterized protein LOC108681492 isoform X2 [Hyalella azteca]|uniref:receptor protein-tyrosine kinase n=1 Tax=Hyalella azteca TaxID=294128 RepID=A0A8B7PKR4_HYAAZ|nr:uncharacterized protein LOC108681492 isoform X2 [Hyalella azteca]
MFISWLKLLLPSVVLLIPVIAEVTVSKHVVRNGTVVCSSITLTTHVPDDVRHELRDCTHVDGHVKLLIVHAQPRDMPLMPNLVEVKESVYLFHVSGVESLGDLFPKLRVVRGKRGEVAFLLRNNQDLVEIGLPGFTLGSPKTGLDIRQNWQLCVPAIPPFTVAPGVIKDNGVYCEYDKHGCHFDDRSCKQFVASKCSCHNGCALSSPLRVTNDSGATAGRIRTSGCCHAQCLAGCTAAGDAGACVACKNFAQEGVCVPACSENFMQYQGYRCLTERQCQLVGGKRLKKDSMQCVLDCPAGRVVETRPGDALPHCTRTGNGICGSITLGSNVEGGALAALPVNCTRVVGSVTLNGALNVSLLELLDSVFSEGVEVTGYVHVTETSLMSLDFLFSKLALVRGEALVGDVHAIYISDNMKLQELRRPRPHFTKDFPRDFGLVANGRVMVRGNSKLCPSEVVNLLGTDITRDSYEAFALLHNERNDVNVPCNLSPIKILSVNSTSRSLTVTWDPNNYKGPNNDLLQGYFLYYRALAPAQTVTMFAGRDACNDRRLWRQVQTPASEAHLRGLQPGTRYAFYVETDVLPSFVQNNHDSMPGSRSTIVYCSTIPQAPSAPQQVQVRQTAEALNSVALSWLPPRQPGGQLADYQVMLCRLKRPPPPTGLPSSTAGACPTVTQPSPAMEKDGVVTPGPDSAVGLQLHHDLHQALEPQQEAEDRHQGGAQACYSPQCDAGEAEWLENKRMLDRVYFFSRINADIYNSGWSPKTGKQETQTTTSPPSADPHSQVADVPSSSLAPDEPASEDKYVHQAPLEQQEFCGTKGGPIQWQLYSLVAFDRGDCAVHVIPHAHDGRHATHFPGLGYFVDFQVSVRACHTNLTAPVGAPFPTGVPVALCSPWVNISLTSPSLESLDSVSDLQLVKLPSKSLTDPHLLVVSPDFPDAELKAGQESHGLTVQNGSKHEGNPETINTSLGLAANSFFNESSTNHAEPVNLSSNASINVGLETLDVSSNSYLLSWTPPATPNGGWVLNYSLEIPGLLTRCLSGSTHKVVLKSIQEAQAHMVTITAYTYAGPGPRVGLASQSLTIEGSQSMLAALLVLCCVFLVIIIVVGLYLRHRLCYSLAPNEFEKQHNPSYAPMEIYDDFFIPADQLLIIPPERGGRLGSGKFGAVSLGWILEPASGQDAEPVDGDDNGRHEGMQELARRSDGGRWRLGKRVAVKELLCDLPDLTFEEYELRKKKFKREASILQCLRQCPFVVRFEGAVVQGPNMYILMEVLDGGNLQEFIRNNHVTEQMVYNFAIQIADGMAYIASNRIIHIDLAPKNCLITRRFLVKIADFGLSRKLAPERCCYHYQIDVPHRKRLKIYLPSFIAPEGRRTQDLHSGHECIVFFLKSDVWSYGVLLWQLITCSNEPYAGKETPAPKDVQRACLWLEGPGRAAKMAELLNSCWLDNQDLRPSFEQIVEQLLPMISPEFTREFRRLSFCVPHQHHDSESTEDEGVGSMPGSSRSEVESCQDLADQVELSRAQGCLRFLSRSGWPPTFSSRHPTFNSRHRAGYGDTGQMTSTRAKVNSRGEGENNSVDLLRNDMQADKKWERRVLPSRSSAKIDGDGQGEAEKFLNPESIKPKKPQARSLVHNFLATVKLVKTTKETENLKANRKVSDAENGAEGRPLIDFKENEPQRLDKCKLNLPLSPLGFTPSQVGMETENLKQNITSPLMVPASQVTRPKLKTQRCSFHASAEKYVDMSPKNLDGLCLDHSTELDDGAVCSSYGCDFQPEETSLDDNLCGYTEMCGAVSLNDIPSVCQIDVEGQKTQDKAQSQSSGSSFEDNLNFKEHITTPGVQRNIETKAFVHSETDGYPVEIISSTMKDSRLSRFCFGSFNSNQNFQRVPSVRFAKSNIESESCPGSCEDFSIVTCPSIDTLYPSASTCTSAVTSPCEEFYDVTTQIDNPAELNQFPKQAQDAAPRDTDSKPHDWNSEDAIGLTQIAHHCDSGIVNEHDGSDMSLDCSLDPPLNVNCPPKGTLAKKSLQSEGGVQAPTLGNCFEVR